MTLYRLMAKENHKDRYQTIGIYFDPVRAESVAVKQAQYDDYKGIKMIVKDDNEITNEIIYK